MTQAYRQKVGKGKSSEENDEMVKQVREASWNSEHWEVSLLVNWKSNGFTHAVFTCLVKLRFASDYE